jgi:hypothetical protein
MLAYISRITCLDGSIRNFVNGMPQSLWNNGFLLEVTPVARQLNSAITQSSIRAQPRVGYDSTCDKTLCQCWLDSVPAGGGIARSSAPAGPSSIRSVCAQHCCTSCCCNAIRHCCHARATRVGRAGRRLSSARVVSPLHQRRHWPLQSRSSSWSSAGRAARGPYRLSIASTALPSVMALWARDMPMRADAIGGSVCLKV